MGGTGAGVRGRGVKKGSSGGGNGAGKKFYLQLR